MKRRQISSRSNEDFKFYLELLTAKGIRKHQQFFISGERIITEFLAHRASGIDDSQKKFAILGQIIPYKGTPFTLPPDSAGPAGLKTGAVSAFSPPLTEMPQEMFQELDVIGTNSPLLLLKYDTQTTPRLNGLGLTLVLPVGDPGNLGAILRSAEAFGVKNVVLTEEASNPYLPKSIKASSGSSLRLHFYRGPKLADIEDFFHSFTAQGTYPKTSPKTPPKTAPETAPMPAPETAPEPTPELWSLDLDGTPLDQMKWPKNLFVVIGEERGLPFAFKNRLSIPTEKVESLNVNVATSIALYAWSRRNV